LQVRLGGENFYEREPVWTPLIGEKFHRPSTREAKQAIRLVAVVSFFGAIAVVLLGRRKR
jgi:cobalamin biosynthesis protein CobD/CbiB